MDKAVPVPVKREGAGYNDTAGSGHRFMSATGIRDLLSIGGSRMHRSGAEFAAEFVPECVTRDVPRADELSEGKRSQGVSSTQGGRLRVRISSETVILRHSSFRKSFRKSETGSVPSS